MNGNRLLALVLGFLVFNSAFSQTIEKKVIYKWERGGLIYYSHIKPLDVSEYSKLDANGRKIEDFTEGFDEIIEITVSPGSAKKKDAKKLTDEELAISENKKDDIKNRNCSIAQKNLKTLAGGEVYERDSKGKMIRLKDEQVASKRKNVQKDIDYFCSE